MAPAKKTTKAPKPAPVETRRELAHGAAEPSRDTLWTATDGTTVRIVPGAQGDLWTNIRPRTAQLAQLVKYTNWTLIPADLFPLTRKDTFS